MVVRIKYNDGRVISLYDVRAILCEGERTIIIVYNRRGEIKSTVVDANECQIEII